MAAARVLEVVCAAQAKLLGRDELTVQVVRQHCDIALALIGEDTELGLAVAGQVAVAVEMVRLHVQQDGALGRERRGVFELEARRLANHGGLRVHRAHQRPKGRADVAGDGHGQAGGAPHRPQELDRGVVFVGLVTATKRCGSRRHASSSSPVTSIPRTSAAATTGACRGTPGLLTTVRTRSSRSTPSVPRCTSASRSTSGAPESHAITSPCGASMRAAALPDRARPTTR